MNEQNQHAEELFDKLSKEKKQRRRRLLRTVALILVLAAAALFATVVILRRNVERRFASNAAEVQAYTVQTGTIHTVVAGSGVLVEEDLETISVPAGVEVTEVLVEAGDAVIRGQLLAKVDLGSVMTALSDLQTQLKTLDTQINDAKDDQVSSYIPAGVSGRVKKLFAQSGTDVSLCMAEHGALALLSLDGYMAVDIPASGLEQGNAVTVVREDGTAIAGKVDRTAGETATVLVTDNGPRWEEEVTVTLGEKTLGTGRLYIHNPLAITGYAGTIHRVSVGENAWVDGYTTVFQLKNTSFSANYDSLLRDRKELEETQLALLTLYRDSALLSPMDGRISSVEFDEDLENTFLLETNVVTLYPDLTMSIGIAIDEMDILALEEGQEARITVESVSQDQVFPGTVTEISKVADTSTGVTRYSCTVTLDKAPGMLAGMTAEVDIRIQGVENALIIPIDALHQTSAVSYVYTAYDPETQQYGGMVEVTTGMRNDSQVEILTGLKPGDVIYYTEAPQNIFEFMMGNMGGRPMGPGDSVTFGPGGGNRGG